MSLHRHARGHICPQFNKTKYLLPEFLLWLLQSFISCAWLLLNIISVFMGPINFGTLKVCNLWTSKVAISWESLTQLVSPTWLGTYWLDCRPRGWTYGKVASVALQCCVKGNLIKVEFWAGIWRRDQIPSDLYETGWSSSCILKGSEDQGRASIHESDEWMYI